VAFGYVNRFSTCDSDALLATLMLRTDHVYMLPELPNLTAKCESRKMAAQCSVEVERGVRLWCNSKCDV
jgi:hypothetical protein